MENIYLEDLTEGKLEVSNEIVDEVKEKCDFLKRKYNIPEEIYELLLKNKTLLAQFPDDARVNLRYSCE